MLIEPTTSPGVGNGQCRGGLASRVAGEKEHPYAPLNSSALTKYLPVLADLYVMRSCYVFRSKNLPTGLQLPCGMRIVLSVAHKICA